MNVVRKIGVLGLMAVAGASQANGILTLDTPNMTAQAGVNQSILVTGKLQITQDYQFLSMFVPHIYIQGSYANRIDAGLLDQNFLTWLGVPGNKFAGAIYIGGFFSLDQEATDPIGLYDHNFASLVAPANTYFEFNSNTPQYVRSNEVSMTVNVVPEPATLAVIGLGLIPLLRRRRK